MKAKFCFTMVSDQSDEIHYALAAKMEVCSRCEGVGHHTNPSIDGNGITSSEWAEWDEDDRETYMRGGYDITCTVCRGANVVAAPDFAKWSFGEKRAYLRHQRDEANWAREDASEAHLRRMEMGGY